MRQLLASLRRGRRPHAEHSDPTPGPTPANQPADAGVLPARRGAPLPLPLGQRLRRCMEATSAPSGGCWTAQEVADAAAAHCATASLERRLLNDLLEGTCADVDPAQLQVLAATFAVPQEYLMGAAEQVDTIDAELELLQALRESGTRDLFVCTRGGRELTSEGRRRIAEMIRSCAPASRATLGGAASPVTSRTHEGDQGDRSHAGGPTDT